MSITVARIDFCTWQPQHLDLALYVMQLRGASLIWGWLSHFMVGAFLYPAWAREPHPIYLGPLIHFCLGLVPSVSLYFGRTHFFHESLTLILGSSFPCLNYLAIHYILTTPFLFPLGYPLVLFLSCFSHRRTSLLSESPQESTSWEFLVLRSEAALVDGGRAGVAL